MEFWFQTDVERLSTNVYSSTHNVCPYSIPHNAELRFCDKSGPQFWEQSGTYFWGPNLVPTSGGQIWYPLLGTKSGTHFWSPLCSKLYSVLSAKLGTHFLAPNLVHTSGRQIWYPLLGTKSGTHFWCHVECIFFTPDFVHSRFGLRFCHTSLPSTLPPTKISSPPPLCYRAWCHDWLGSNRTNHGTLSLLKASLAGHMVRVLARLSALARNLFGKKCSSIK